MTIQSTTPYNKQPKSNPLDYLKFTDRASYLKYIDHADYLKYGIQTSNTNSFLSDAHIAKEKSNKNNRY